MDAQTDFQRTIEPAVGLAVDVAYLVRSAGRGPLPPHVRRLVRSANRNFERATSDLFEAYHAKWEQQPPPRQLELAA